jgi:hypothetical protein
MSTDRLTAVLIILQVGQAIILALLAIEVRELGHEIGYLRSKVR